MLQNVECLFNWTVKQNSFRERDLLKAFMAFAYCTDIAINHSGALSVDFCTYLLVVFFQLYCMHIVNHCTEVKSDRIIVVNS